MSNRNLVKERIQEIIKGIEVEKEAMRLFRNLPDELIEEAGIEKAIVYVAMLNETDQYSPLSTSGKSVARQLEKI